MKENRKSERQFKPAENHHGYCFHLDYFHLCYNEKSGDPPLTVTELRSTNLTKGNLLHITDSLMAEVQNPRQILLSSK